MSPQRLLLLLLSLSLTWVGCDDDPTPTPDAGTQTGTDAGGRDGSTPDDPDGGSPDGSTPDGSDGGTPDGSTPDNSDGGSPDGSTPDGTDGGTPDGTDGGTPDGSTPVDPTAVTLTRVFRYHTASGVETVADTSATVPEVLIPDGASFRRIAGTSTGGANYRFTGIPAGSTYYLKRGTTYFVTDARTVDLSVDLLGRADAELLLDNGGDMNTRFDVSGLEPLASDQELATSVFQVISGEVDFAGYVYSADLPPGQTTFTGEVQANNIVAAGVPRFIAERGDRAWVNQFIRREADGTLADGGTLHYETVVRSLHLPPFSYDGGTPVEVQGALQPVPMTDFTLDWRLSAFAAYAPAAHPGATSSTSSFTVVPAAHGLDYGWVGYSGELLNLATLRGTAEDFVGHMSYGNPFPSTWGVLGTATHNFRYPTTLPGGAAIVLGGSMSTSDRMPNLVAGPIVPRLSPARGLTIDGQDAYVPRTLEGDSHVVSWTQPELGTPSLYSLTLYRYDPPNEERPFAFATIVTRFYVTGAIRSVQLPAEHLQPGKDYYLRLTAYSGAPGVDLASAPLITGNKVPLYDATTVSAILTTP